jgi:hypothetical protein
MGWLPRLFLIETRLSKPRHYCFRVHAMSGIAKHAEHE